MKQTVRIISGKYRGRRLHFPEIQGLRPTTDRVRETVFNWLMHDIRNARVLDAFSGSGAFGFEAASRGAKTVMMVERCQQAANALRQQAELWEVKNATIICRDVLSFLQQTQQEYDIIFLDPPFESQLLEPTLDLILDQSLIHPSGLIYVETAVGEPFDYPCLQLIKEKQAGQVCYRLLRR